METPDGGNVDNPSAVILQHKRYGSAAGVKTGVQIYRKDTMPLLGSHVTQQPDVRDACIIYKHIQSGNMGEDSIDLIFTAHVGLQGKTGNLVLSCQLIRIGAQLFNGVL